MESPPSMMISRSPISIMAESPVPTSRKWTAHVFAMVEKYAHQNGAHIQAAMDKLEKRIRVVSR